MIFKKFILLGMAIFVFGDESHRFADEHAVHDQE